MTKRFTTAALGASLVILAAVTAAKAEPYLQCVPFARTLSGINLFGDAWTWWEQATGKYAKGDTPKLGAVLVFKSEGHMRHGHVAVVSRVLTDRIIEISHANWSPIDGGRGKVEENVTAVDVSPKGDWTVPKHGNAELSHLRLHLSERSERRRAGCRARCDAGRDADCDPGRDARG
jgi:hypothetical protein